MPHIEVDSTMSTVVVDPGFPVGGAANLVEGGQLPIQLYCVKCVCQNKRIGTLRGRVPGAPPGSATALVN